MKKTIIILSLLTLSMWVSAQTADTTAIATDTIAVATDTIAADTTATDTTAINRLTIGARIGAASLLQKTVADAKGQFGFDALLDLQYAHYWIKKNDNKFGILTGLTLGYVQTGFRSNGSHQQYTLTDPDGWKAQYDVTVGALREKDYQLQLEIPVMFSMVLGKGFFLNAGPKLLLPVYASYKQTVENSTINAYFEQTDVTVRNEDITGRATDEQLIGKGKSNNRLKLNITLGAELGYEWQLNNGNSLGLGAYVNGGLYSMYKNDNATDQAGIVAVTPAVPSKVTIFSATDTWTKKMGFVDFGLKLAYHFNWYK